MLYAYLKVIKHFKAVIHILQPQSGVFLKT